MSTPLEGWRWVPVEATEEMIRAACDCQPPAVVAELGGKA